MKVVKWCRKKWNEHNMMYIYHKQCKIKQKNRWNSSNGQIHWFPIDFQWKCYRDLKHPTSCKNFTAAVGQNHALIHTQCLNLLKCSFFIWDLPWLNGGPTASDYFRSQMKLGPDNPISHKMLWVTKEIWWPVGCVLWSVRCCVALRRTL